MTTRPAPAAKIRRGYDYVQAELKARATRTAKAAAAEHEHASELAVDDVMLHTNRKGTVKTVIVVAAPTTDDLGVALVRVFVPDKYGYGYETVVKVDALTRAA